MKHLGFLTVIEYQRLGLIGGYLILDRLGRPLEFHCTTPVKANRAQEILYGVTLDAFLYGEQIAQTLIRRAKVKPCTVLTDRPQVLAVQDFIEIPIAFIDTRSVKEQKLQICGIESQFPEEPEESKSIKEPLVAEHCISFAKWSEHFVGRYQLMLPEQPTCPASQTADELKNVSSTIDFLEPFERIRLAIAEAQKAA